MTFEPVLPLSGYAGWTFLTRTLTEQQQAHSTSPARQRETDYFAENIGNVLTAEDLVSDRRLLGVALGAFGLDEDIDFRAFIQQVLSDGTTQPEAISNRLADKRYLAFSEAFGFGEGIPPRTQLSGFAQEIIDAYEERQFEISVGAQNESLRLALTAVRELPDIASDSTSNTTKWFTIMGNPPLRQVFETALGLPSSIGSVDLDQQLDVFQDRATSVFGTDQVADFIDADLQEDLVQSFLLRQQLVEGSGGLRAGEAAIQLLANIA